MTSGIDFALRVAAKLRGRLNAEFAQLIIEYDPDPPFRAGHPRVAPPEVMALAKKKMPGGLKGLQKIPALFRRCQNIALSGSVTGLSGRFLIIGGEETGLPEVLK
ncbi:Uncharacterised protein [Serratia rubidaea]|uniref:Uncharacterized protein n=1 Tax=Serratia rubidaea TaxID=61652 RepID=A0A3S4GAH2_SERRU|nr:Uncharacterised protein [Serratia rubidaea]